VNNDTEFTPGLVHRLAKTLDMHPMVGMVSPKIRYYSQPDTLQYAGYTKMNYFTARNKCIGQYEKDNGQYDNLTGQTGYIHGAAMMVRGEAVQKVGGMSEVYFLYFEEYDWCEMIKRASYEIWVDMQALIYHKESVSVGSKSALKEYFMTRNRILFIRRNCNVLTTAVFCAYFMAVVVPRNILSYKKNGQDGFASILFRAIKWNITHNTHSTNLGFPVKNSA
jgi:GT2 family glycosyltransferase